MKMFFFTLIITATMASCVSTKKFKAAEMRYQELSGKYADLQNKLKECNAKNTDNSAKQITDESQIADLKRQIDFLKQNNTQALKQLQDLSVISGAQAKSIAKSLENIGSKDQYIQSLESSLKHKDSLNMVLVNNLKGAVGDLNDKDINIKIDKGVIYIDISDKLLFRSGSYDVTADASIVLGKVAKVLINQPEIEFMVEGHTDNIPFKRGLLLDNWDLSVKRATSVVRILQNKYGLPATHISAAGRSEYLPLEPNTTAEGRAANRRTRIIILPQLDQFFKLLEKK